MHITAHQLMEEFKTVLLPAACGILAAIAIPLIGIALFFLRGFAVMGIGLVLALGLLHFCVVRHRATENEDEPDA